MPSPRFSNTNSSSRMTRVTRAHARSLFLSADVERGGLVSLRQGRRAQASTKNSARNCARWMAWPAPALPSGRRMPSASAWWAISTAGTGVIIAMRSLGASGVWEIFIPGVGEGAHYKFEIRDAQRPHQAEDRSVRLLHGSAAQAGRHRLEQQQIQVDRRRVAEAAQANATRCDRR